VGYAFAAGQSGRPIDCESAVELLTPRSAPAADSSILWLHFSLANAAAERWMRQNLALPINLIAGLFGITWEEFPWRRAGTVLPQ
jgi:hypothetical protein